MDNWKNQQSLKKVEYEQLKNVLHQYGKRIDLDKYTDDVDVPFVVATPSKFTESITDVKILSLWFDEKGILRCKATERDCDEEITVHIDTDVLYGYMGDITEAVIDIAEHEGITLDPCKPYNQAEREKSLAEAKTAINNFYMRNSCLGDLTKLDDKLTLYLGGMPFVVDSLYYNRDWGWMADGSSYEMKAFIHVYTLGIANLDIIRSFCNKH